MHDVAPHEIGYKLEGMVARLQEIHPGFLPTGDKAARRKMQRVLKTPIGACFKPASHGCNYGQAILWTVSSVDALPANYGAYISATKRAARLGEVVTVVSAGAIARAA